MVCKLDLHLFQLVSGSPDDVTQGTQLGEGGRGGRGGREGGREGREEDMTCSRKQPYNTPLNKCKMT